MDSGSSPIRTTIKYLTAGGVGTALLVLSGLLLTATVTAVVTATPLLVLFSPILVPAAIIFSPILVPAGIAVFLTVTGMLLAGGFSVTAASVVTWIYRYATGMHPLGADTINSAGMSVARKARNVTALVVLGGLLLAGTVIALVMATPILVLFSPILVPFSPILVPAGIAVFLAVSGLLASGAAVSVVVWIYKYVAGKHPVGADQLDSARKRLVQTAMDAKDKTMGYG